MFKIETATDPRVTRALQALSDAYSLPLSTWRAATIAYWQRELDRLAAEPSGIAWYAEAA